LSVVNIGQSPLLPRPIILPIFLRVLIFALRFNTLERQAPVNHIWNFTDLADAITAPLSKQTAPVNRRRYLHVVSMQKEAASTPVRMS
jgi:hypothetical protein